MIRKLQFPIQYDAQVFHLLHDLYIHPIARNIEVVQLRDSVPGTNNHCIVTLAAKYEENRDMRKGGFPYQNMQIHSRTQVCRHAQKAGLNLFNSTSVRFICMLMIHVCPRITLSSVVTWAYGCS